MKINALIKQLVKRNAPIKPVAINEGFLSLAENSVLASLTILDIIGTNKSHKNSPVTEKLNVICRADINKNKTTPHPKSAIIAEANRVLANGIFWLAEVSACLLLKSPLIDEEKVASTNLEIVNIIVTNENHMVAPITKSPYGLI